MQVSTIVGAQAAYACIKTVDVSLDVRLEPGKSAPASLRQWAAEQIATAERLQRNASLALAASMQLEQVDSTRKRPYRCTGDKRKADGRLTWARAYRSAWMDAWTTASALASPAPLTAAGQAHHGPQIGGAHGG